MDLGLLNIVVNGDVEKLQCLLACKVNLLKAKNQSGANILHIAVTNRQIECVRWIVDHLPELCKEKNLVGLAADCEGLQVTQFLLDHGADVNAIDKSGFSPVNAALKAGNTETVKLLLEKGATLAPIDFLCVNTAMHWPILQTMLQHEPTYVNSANADGYSLLMKVARYDSEEKLKELLEIGADHSLQSSRGTTALLEAVRSECPGKVKLLLVYGADPTVQDKEGNNVLSLACECDYHADEILTLFHQCQAFLINSFQFALEYKHPMAVVLRKKRSPDLLRFMLTSEIFCDRNFIIHEDFFNVDMLKRFNSSDMALGAISYLLHNPECSLITDDTTWELLQILLSANFPVNSFNNSIPPLTILLSCSYADISNKNKFMELVELLIQHGAHIHDMSLVPTGEKMADIAPLRQETFLPDALLMAAFAHNYKSTSFFRPFWAAAPLGMLALITNIEYVDKMYYYLAKHGVPPGSLLCEQLRKRLPHLRSFPRRVFPTIVDHFNNMTSQPLSLLELSKFAVRIQFAKNCQQVGSQTLPQQLQEVWPPSLRDLVLFKDEEVEPMI
ncbi:hypothetical protein B566_EDAN014279 [Ephemera danica]|nr:hypothetical protein B566_EDAN014279 [Ephemera danica]